MFMPASKPDLGKKGRLLKMEIESLDYFAAICTDYFVRKGGS
ncbi:predicted coding region AF_1880 [Archaeoglobus fulgidus DSM 4304]|uniref:Uncharacterized protein AF_1880 n=1 Tax=Archaeoglobus fulgidus (strain ATCC 49558 / DSM 4304 / JCM 9628 / NBRC 100126 / VC-16) TaxID=224325 RepID=Y1880_ARCFU|nr:RecName: Full=Uncharacterized protein AF_1880 [Archaeoglobus fulgidus DSM 4304]AAB89386.1 predicted coding region AF_1880 [Archaeoglobus fulgidus DSM 4304]